MQLATKHNTVQTGSVVKSGEFGIAKNAKMFQILSDSMYKDKIGSMVRELASNARDAHVDAGKPEVPFVIHLPNAFEPWFSVTDFGTGIGPEEIYSILCVYGESTKDQSNDAIGAFGLGAKTPFAYTDNFTVRSRVDGVERLYTASTGEYGLPTLSLQVETETAEGNGFQLTVSVNESDFNRFANKVVEQLKFFPVKPIIENSDGLVWPDLDNQVLYQSDLVTMYDGHFGTPIDGLWVTQGGVGYPVDLGNLNDIDSETMSFGKALAANDSVLHFEIGDIDVTAPREAISYDDRTIKNIVDRLRHVANVMCREVLVDIQKEDSIWNRAVIYNKQINVVQRAIRQSPLFDKLFVGMDKDRHGLLAVNMDDLTALDFVAVYMGKHNSHRSNSAGTTVRRKVLGNYSRYGDEYLTPTKEITVFLRDTKSKPMARAKYYVIENDFPLTIVIEGDDILDASDKERVAKALRMPVSNIRLLSEIEPPKHISHSDRSAYTAPKCYQWKSGDSTSYSRDWERMYDDINDVGTAVWVEMDRHDIKWREDTALMFRALESGVLGYDVIAVNGRTARRIENGKIGEDLISVEEVAKELRAKIKTETSRFVKYARDNAFMQQMQKSSVIMTLCENGTFPALNKRITNMAAKNAAMGEHLRQNRWMQVFINGLHDSAERGTNAAMAVTAEVFAQYPMLTYVSGRSGALLEDDVLADVQQYIEEKDKVGVDTST